MHKQNKHWTKSKHAKGSNYYVGVATETLCFLLTVGITFYLVLAMGVAMGAL